MLYISADDLYGKIPFTCNLSNYLIIYNIMFLTLEKDPHVLKTTNQYQTIEDLHKFTNYTVWVLAYTKVGDGIKSKPFFCTTHEDVPSGPFDIKYARQY